ncbi:hypothetical protein T11_4865 [Trichinella zimbabwensis]|uniref:Uncharacterized protein n=1 Tax=Trichinella zimbabwensis TaxID=268475 RepID=A0A0V1GXK5_9BILA|nr:hypothetical protein T11_4865 [Trichinella zimbabwensis]
MNGRRLSNGRVLFHTREPHASVSTQRKRGWSAERHLVHAKNGRPCRNHTLVTIVTLFTIRHDITFYYATIRNQTRKNGNALARHKSNNNNNELPESGGTVVTCMPAHHVVTLANLNIYIVRDKLLSLAGWWTVLLVHAGVQPYQIVQPLINPVRF